MTGGPSPSRSKAMVVPSGEATSWNVSHIDDLLRGSPRSRSPPARVDPLSRPAPVRPIIHAMSPSAPPDFGYPPSQMFDGRGPQVPKEQSARSHQPLTSAFKGIVSQSSRPYQPTRSSSYCA